MRIVRPAEPNDVGALVPLLVGLLAEHQHRYPDTYPRLDPIAAAAVYSDDWRRRVGVDPTCNVWLAADRDVRGFLAGEVLTRAVGEPPTAFFMEWLYVIPEYRGSGIARALYRDGLVPFCRRHGIDALEGRIEPGDTQWTRRGWATVAHTILRTVDAVARDVAERPEIDGVESE